jgi:hypothetical protein
VKRVYGRTNKKDATAQIAKHERCQAHFAQALEVAKTTEQAKQIHSHHVGLSEVDPLPPTSPDMHHHISNSKNHPCDIFSFMHKYNHDPATKVYLLPVFTYDLIHHLQQDFAVKLKNHLLTRLLNLDQYSEEHDFTDEDR